MEKQTLNPIFNETFELKAPTFLSLQDMYRQKCCSNYNYCNYNVTVWTADPSQLKQDGTILFLGMYDHDAFGSDGFSGICVVPCNTTTLKGNECKLEHFFTMNFIGPTNNKVGVVFLYIRRCNIFWHLLQKLEIIFVSVVLCSGFLRFTVLHEVNLEQRY